MIVENPGEGVESVTKRMLTAESVNCFSNRFVLKLNGRSFGEIRGRWWNSSKQIQLLERRTLIFEATNFWASGFQIRDDDAAIYGVARSTGVFRRRWLLKLNSGAASLEPAGWFSYSKHVTRGDEVIATVKRESECGRGWSVTTENEQLLVSEMLFIGLLYQTLREQEEAAASS